MILDFSRGTLEPFVLGHTQQMQEPQIAQFRERNRMIAI